MDYSRPANRLVGILNGRWTLAIVTELQQSGCRYRDLHQALNGISHKMLTETLRRAERDGLIDRHLDATHIDTATLYRLTELGQSLEEPLTAVSRWTEVNWILVEDARRRWDEREQ
jgi:DNA-binding HxlR family transcriptional regulator